MKNIVSVLVVGLFIFTSLGATAFSRDVSEQIITIDTISFSPPLLSEQNDYTILALPEATTNLMQTAKPCLPMISKVYVYPFGTIIRTIDVAFAASTELLLDKPVMRSQEPQIVSTDIKQSLGTSMDTLQSTETWYPSSSYSYRVGSGIQNGERVVFLTVYIYPVQYQQKENKIRYYRDATIHIFSAPPENPANFVDAFTLLILTPSQFTAQLQPLVTYKNENNVPTMMVPLDDIPNVGADIQEDIKYYIKNAIETWGITSVILVGAGLEDQEVFPVRNAWIPSGSYEEYFPSDLYYADIYNQVGNFSDWDFDNDGKYCEYPSDLPATDLYPDVYLSRLACNDAGEVTTVVNKIIDFKEHNKVMNKILQLGGDTFPGDNENINEGEYSNTIVMTKLPDYITTRLWGSLGTLTKENIRNNINKGVDFVDCSGHGSWASWATHPPSDDTVWIPEKTFYSPYTGFLYIDINLFLNSKKLPVFVLNACSTSKFSESSSCLSWNIVSQADGGGIASFGASGIGYGMYGSAETERLWGWMEVNLFEELSTTKMLGEVWVNVINDYLNTFIPLNDSGDADYKTVVEIALFGDPTTLIDDGKNPQSYASTDGINHLFRQYGAQRALFTTMFSVLKQIREQHNQN